MNRIFDNYLKKMLLSVVSIIFVFSILSTSVLAKVPENVVKQATDSIMTNFKDILDGEREHYGLSSSDNIENLIIGEGVAYKDIDLDNINSSSSSFNNIVKRRNNVEYIFPLKVGDKPCGIAFVEKINGKWVATRLSSDLTFQSRLSKAKNNFKKRGFSNNGNDLTLIYDTQLNFYGLYSNKSDSINMINDNIVLNLKENDIKTYSDLKDEFIKLKSDMEKNSIEGQYFGGFSPEPEEMSYIPYLIIFSILVVGIVVLVMIKRKAINK